MGQESPKERIDRELMELLNELRIALPGVQMLFGFLLTVPFAAGFTKAGTFHRALLLVALLAGALAIACLVAPAAQHRILFRAQRKKDLLWRANLYAIGGITLLGVSISTAVLLVVDYLFHFRVAAVCTAVVAFVLVATWLAQPLWHRGRHELDDIFDRDEMAEEEPARR
jgi:putative flippase GtrA